MNIDIFICRKLRIKNSKKILSEHPVIAFYNVMNEKNKYFLFNLTTSSHKKDSLNYLTRFENGQPIEFTAFLKNNSCYKMFLVRDCAVVDKSKIAKRRTKNKIWLVKKNECKNYDDLVDDVLNVIYDNPFDIIMYDGITDKIISENINNNLLKEVDEHIGK